MPSVLLTESIQVELGASEPWPENAKLFQPFEADQILLPSNASSLSVQAFLHMCGLPFELEMKKNAEHMSPSGNIPFLHCGSFVISEFDHIVGFVNNKGINLSGHLSDSQRADMRAYMSLINTILINAELYISWCDSSMEEVTKQRYGSVYPWPLNRILIWRKQSQVKKRLSDLGWMKKSLEDIYAEVDGCCKALSERLDTHKYFFNDKPTELDALVFGHVFTILTTSLPHNQLASVINGNGNLIKLCQRIEHEFFDNK